MIVRFDTRFQLRSVASVQESIDFSFVDKRHDSLTSWMAFFEIADVINKIIEDYKILDWDLRLRIVMSVNALSKR